METGATVQSYQYDYLIAGSGLAGLAIALEAAKHGRVAVLTKHWVRDSNSYHAQGGIAAVTDPEDTAQGHIADTLAAGRGLCDLPAVEALVKEAPERIQELIDSGMHFDHKNGEIALGLEGGHHHRRILHAGGDATGMLTTSFVAGEVAKQSNIDIYENHCVLETLIDQGKCYGLRVWDTSNGQESIFTAKYTMLALGGTGAIYQRTTNPETTVGDSIALAYNAGCQITDLEFIQFHPTALYIEGQPAFLISEAVRGEGAHLYNQNNERFMAGKYPLAELEPRDTVAKAIFREIQNQELPYVWLDLRHLKPELIEQRFPTISRYCHERGYELTDRIPIAPAAHYMVGGVRTDLHGQTAIPNLYAVGEMASNGLMGANRLASNSLIECLVYAHRAVQHSLSQPPATAPEGFEPQFTFDPDLAGTYESTRAKIAALLNAKVGIIRSGETLQEALKQLDSMESDLALKPKEYNSHQLRNLFTVARLLITAALYREESRGGHYREDFPEEREEFNCHLTQQKGLDIAKTPVIDG
ncbi:MAG: L-aspartate oxidase [Bacteroidetes bacterium]|nr:MAG: L-aspartate oxidase [Bacteroidota bacterium]